MADSPAGDYFNIHEMMTKFYEYQPSSDDAYGSAIKGSFQANMIQSAYDTANAKELSQFQTGLSQDTMAHAAELELLNQSANMQQEYNLGMASMEGQMTLQNEYADKQTDRDISLLGATGEQERKNIAAAGEQDIIKRINEGEQERLTDTNRVESAGKEQRAIDQNKIVSEGIEQRAGIRESGTEERKGIQEKGKVDTALERVKGYEQREGIKESGTQQRAAITTQGAEERKGYESKGAQDRLGIKETGAQQRLGYESQGAQERLNIGARGKDTRETMGYENRLKAKDRANQSQYSKQGARSF